MAQDANGPYIGARPFQFVVESVLHGGPDDCPLPIVVYLDNIAVYGDT